MQTPILQPGGSTTARILPDGRPPGDWVDLGATTFQTPVPPNTTVPVQTEVNSKTIADPVDRGHPDHCDPPGALAFDGVEVEVQVSVEASSGKNQACLNIEANGPLLFDTEVVAPPSPGEYEVSVSVVGVNTGEVYDTDTTTITVTGDAPDPPKDPPDDDNENGGGGDSPLDDILPGSGLTTGALLGLGAVVVFLILLVSLQQ